MDSQENQHNQHQAAQGWIRYCGDAAPDLENELAASVRARLAEGLFKPEDVEHIRTLPLRIIEKSADFSNDRLERLRRLCQLWYLEIKEGQISSHRRIVGPIIVAVKRLLFPIFRAFFKETLQQQRAFNAEVIELMADLSRGR
jgi:hypothetical protein